MIASQKCALRDGRRFGHTLRKGVKPMLSLTPVTVTFHILGFVITIRIKGENRHPAR